MRVVLVNAASKPPTFTVAVLVPPGVLLAVVRRRKVLPLLMVPWAAG